MGGGGVSMGCVYCSCQLFVLVHVLELTSGNFEALASDCLVSHNACISELISTASLYYVSVSDKQTLSQTSVELV